VLFANVSASGIGLRFAIAATAGCFFYQQFLIRHRQREACFDAFRNNVWVGFALFAGAVFDANLLPLLTGARFFGVTL